MKWRLTYGDPNVKPRTILDRARVEVPAGPAGDLISIEAADKAADKRRVAMHRGWTLLKAELVADDDQIIEWVIPHPVARLAFNPAEIEDPVFRQMWDDALARTLWLGISWQHLVGEGLPRECLAVARILRATPPADSEHLKTLARRGGISTYGLAEALWEQLLPYVLDQKHFGYEVLKKGPQPTPAIA
ncbi:MAG: hypothetical protein HY471_01800 [Candidatus Sungbacteria bacterium]|nr:hypothetical protein [Candidatus Sungbacteria bacterium]